MVEPEIITTTTRDDNENVINSNSNSNTSTGTAIRIKPTIRTITAFLTLEPKNFDVTWGSLFSAHDLDAKVTQCVQLLHAVRDELMATTAEGDGGYEVQTLRIATNPFGEWMTGDDHDDDDIPSGSRKHHQRQQQGQQPKRKKLKRMDKLNRLERLDQLLKNHNIDFCSVGPATNEEESKLCIDIVALSHRFSCSQIVEAGNVMQATTAANTILAISKLGQGGQGDAGGGSDKQQQQQQQQQQPHIQDGLGNFRFCSASYCRPGIPFFPAAKAESSSSKVSCSSSSLPPSSPLPIPFAIGLENGPVVQQLLAECQSIANIGSQFRDAYAQLLEPIQRIARSVAAAQDHHGNNATFLGIDSSLNPSLDPNNTGSIAAAMEQLQEIKVFGGHGTLAAAAEITKALQSLPNIDFTGYCGLMLPLCEDTRLAELASSSSSPSSPSSSMRTAPTTTPTPTPTISKKDHDTDDDYPAAQAQAQARQRPLGISDLLSISSVCGVGVDTVPVAGNVTSEQLASLILDVAGIAGRWNKPLSCRVFPVPGKVAGERTTFDSSPYMVNSDILSLE